MLLSTGSILAPQHAHDFVGGLGGERAVLHRPAARDGFQPLAKYVVFAAGGRALDDDAALRASAHRNPVAGADAAASRTALGSVT